MVNLNTYFKYVRFLFRRQNPSKSIQIKSVVFLRNLRCLLNVTSLKVPNVFWRRLFASFVFKCTIMANHHSCQDEL